MVEDLISTGGSSLHAAEALRKAGFQVWWAWLRFLPMGLTLPKRILKKREFPLVCLSDFSHLLKEAVGKKFIGEDEIVYVKSWRLDPGNWNDLIPGPSPKEKGGVT